MNLKEEWKLEETFDLITCSLVLEHIEDLNHIFKEASKVLKQGGLFYLGEVHPMKQYLGTKARFDNGNGVFEVECFVHHTMDYFQAGKNNGFECYEFKEWFDDNGKVPRLLTMIFRKK
jgi:ubiquinone/menaquinone biosynthesis C-methylase UbiE